VTIQITDVVAVATTMMAAWLLVPLYTDFIAQWTGEAGGLTAMLAGLIVPVIFLGIMVSVGISARRAT